MKPLHLILLIGMNLLWAGTYSIFKVLGENLSAGSIATLRYSLAALFMVLTWRWLPGAGLRARDWGRVGLMGVLVFCVAPRLQISGVHLGRAGDTSLLVALAPLVTAVAAAVFLHERIPLRRWWGFALGMLGVVLMSNVWFGAEPLHGVLPNLLFVASFVSESSYSVIGKPLLKRVGALKLVAAALVSGAAANGLLEFLPGSPRTLAALPGLPVRDWLLLLYLAAICTVVGFTLWYIVIRETEVNLTGLTVFVQPLAGLALAVVWVGERLHWGQLWGSLAIIAGLIVGMRRNGRVHRQIVVVTPPPKSERNG